MAIPAILIREQADARRSEQRWRVRLGAHRLDSELSAQLLTVHDLSASGLLFETEQKLGPGSYLIVEMPGKITKICKTVWNSGKFHGATFSDSLSDTELQELINSSPVVWLDFAVATNTAPKETPTQGSQGLPDNSIIDDDDKLPLAIRLMIIIGTSVVLWTLIGISIWLALG